MNKEILKFPIEVRKIVNSDFLTVFAINIDKQEKFIERYEKILTDLLSQANQKICKEEAFKNFETYKNRLKNILNEILREDNLLDFDQEFTIFNNQVERFLDTINEIEIQDQLPERFSSQENDSFLIKSGKSFKRLFRTVGGWPLGFSNFFRKLFKKPIKSKPAATHKIRLRDLTRAYLKERLSEGLLDALDIYYKTVSHSAQLIWQIDEQIDQQIDNFIANGEPIISSDSFVVNINTAKSKLQRLKESLAAEVSKVIDVQYEALLKDYYKVGTFELSNKKFSEVSSIKRHYKINQKYLSKKKSWNNTLLILTDDWLIDIEIYALIYSGYKVFYTSEKEFVKRVNQNIKKSISKITQELKQYRDDIASLSEHENSLIKLKFNELIDLIQSDIEGKCVPSSIELILSQDLPSLINNIEGGLNEELIQLSQKRAVLKGAKYDEPVRSSLSYISPRELINFESWPRFQKVGQASKIQITAKINEIQQTLLQLGQIAAFNLDSALSLIEDENGKNTPIEVAIEGLERTIQKTESLDQILIDINEIVQTELLLNLQKFNGSLVKFTDNENIFEIRLRIAKAKAIQRSKEIKKEWVNKIKNLIPIVWVNLKSKYSDSKTFIQGLFDKYGLSSEKSDISSEIADFLAETQQAVERLPFVYQRLFRSVPLHDFHLFDGRSEEVNALNTAYNNFSKGRFAATVIVGEKGSGITTLLNYFIDELTTASKRIRLDSDQIFHTSDKLLVFLSKGLDKEFETVDQLVEHLNNGQKKVIILENMQKNYLKVVTGFEAFSLFLEIISLTSKNVFWLTTCTVYAWNYLEKTIKISDHFSYKIDIKPLGDEVITNIISKRHQISGYNLKFEPPVSFLNNKKFKKLEEKEQQRNLRDEYFNDLNKISKSNISLALVYWLRSTSKIEDNTIYIASLKQFDFGFMNNLALQKLHALTYLLLHDGLDEASFCYCVNKNLLQARSILHPLYEDGILIQKNGQYLINPLLYRQTVELLKTKNIIH